MQHCGSSGAAAESEEGGEDGLGLEVSARISKRFKQLGIFVQCYIDNNTKENSNMLYRANPIKHVVEINYRAKVYLQLQLLRKARESKTFSATRRGNKLGKTTRDINEHNLINFKNHLYPLQRTGHFSSTIENFLHNHL